MKKKLLPLAIAAAMAPGFASAADVSGYADIIYTIADDAGATSASTVAATEGKFFATSELQFSASPADGVTVRVDVDLDLAAGSTNITDALTEAETAPAPYDKGANDSGRLEQAFFAWGAMEGVTVIGGVFNNPIGYEAEDAPDIDFTSRGYVYSTLDGATALNGDNVAGLAVAGAVGPATITVALLNDLGQVDDESSMAFVVNYSPIEGLDLEAGMVTQSATGTANAVGSSVGDVTNFNVVYTGVENLTLGVDYLDADVLTDAMYDLWAGYSFGAAAVKARMSDNGTASATTLYASYQVASNLLAALEIRSDDPGTAGSTTSDMTTLELIATF